MKFVVEYTTCNLYDGYWDGFVTQYVEVEPDTIGHAVRDAHVHIVEELTADCRKGSPYTRFEITKVTNDAGEMWERHGIRRTGTGPKTLTALHKRN